MIKNTKHFVDEQITKEDEINANKKISTFSIFEEIRITNQILNHLNFENLFINLFERCEEKTKIIEKFVEYCLEVDIDDVKDKFITIFILGKIKDQFILDAVLKGIESNLFDINEYDDILRVIFKETQKNRN